MDQEKTGRRIARLRKEKGWTQKELAERLYVGHKAVSKWETGRGLPDLSLLPELGRLLGVQAEHLLEGGEEENPESGGNMKKSVFSICPVCGNLVLSTGETQVYCCGRRLEALVPRKAEPEERLRAEPVEDDWFITGEHPMEKENYIPFVAFLQGDRVQLVRQYPEWNLQLRIPRRGRGMLVWYEKEKGLLYQLL